MTDAGSRCPCGTGLAYGECCGPLHTGERRAATAEQLMRSRYSAFAVGLADYVLASWHPSTRPATIELEGDLVWRSLDVVGLSGGGPFDAAGTVEFRAIWRQGAQRGVLHERSRFARENGAWYYVDGELLPG
ncbi:MAG: YchJ family protein [Microbacteriaceae bacterium]|nr:YchJ family protein [Microbacteriaceae bacterium]MCL2795662.1 YchJ family protein [Microbacteriaceae bacterium]